MTPANRPQQQYTTDMAMRPLIARVQNGRLQLDVQTDLPEGSVVKLHVTDDAGDGAGGDDVEVNEADFVLAPNATDDGLNDAERAALHRDLAASFADIDAGRVYSAEQMRAALDAQAK